MKKSLTESPERFQDPLGAYIKTRSTVHEQRMGRFPAVNEVYDGLYVSVCPQDKEGRAFLGGAEGIVGSALTLHFFDEGPGLVTRDGRRIALLEGASAARLTKLQEKGWIIRPLLAYTVYRVADRSFVGHFACLCYSSQLDEEVKSALEALVGGIAERIASGSRPRLDLNQEQFVKVIESKGAWCLMPELPWPELPEGSVFYRRRRSFNDRLISAGLEGNKGCFVAAWAGMALMVLAIVAIIWWLLF
jgi:hypothetical protein